MGTSVLLVALVAVNIPSQTIPDEALAKQEDAFRRTWGVDLNRKFDELPTEGRVPEFRVPYSGYIYPDTAGGTMSALRKYDMAYNGRRYLATSHERWDTTAYRQTINVPRRVGFFGRTIMTRVTRTPHWHGHCNGWTSASIRHAEPRQSVRYNGVTFSPADIKALLAEIYMYNKMEMLAGIDFALDAGTLHITMANWLGRGAHPVAMEADPGKEKWNYPIYAYSTSSARRGDRRVEVKMNLAYAMSSRGEYQRSPRIKRTKYFHYYLDLDENDEIIGGRFYRDSSRIDMLWIPLSPRPSGQEGNERGNPHVNVNNVLAIWRGSVDEETRMKWLVVDPPDEDRIPNASELAELVPLGHQPLEVAEANIEQPAAGEAELANAEIAADGETAVELAAADETATDETAADETAPVATAANEPATAGGTQDPEVQVGADNSSASEETTEATESSATEETTEATESSATEETTDAPVAVGTTDPDE